MANKQADKIADNYFDLMTDLIIQLDSAKIGGVQLDNLNRYVNLFEAGRNAGTFYSRREWVAYRWAKMQVGSKATHNLRVWAVIYTLCGGLLGMYVGYLIGRMHG